MAFSSLAPRNCATEMEVPMQKPTIKNTVTPMTVAQMPTAEKALVLTNCPTMMESTMLYSC